jgi:hypothetical protein
MTRVKEKLTLVAYAHGLEWLRPRGKWMDQITDELAQSRWEEEERVRSFLRLGH